MSIENSLFLKVQRGAGVIRSRSNGANERICVKVPRGCWGETMFRVLMAGLERAYESDSWGRWLPTSFPGSLFSASLSRWNRDPGCGWSRDHLSIQNRRVGGYSGTFGREDDKIPPCCPTLPADFSTTQILGGHVTSLNQGLSSSVPTTKGGREERRWERDWVTASLSRSIQVKLDTTYLWMNETLWI